MNPFHSIKWRLQLWHGLVLFAVLAGLGATAYQLERSRLMGHLDAEMDRRFPILAQALHGPPRDRPPPEDFPDGEPPPPPRFHKFVLPESDASLFSASDPNDFYYIIKGRRGEELGRSTNTPPEYLSIKVSLPNLGSVNTAPNFDPPPTPWKLQNIRTSFHPLPSGERVVIGCSTAPEMRELKKTALRLAGAGAVILLFGWAGGWWITSRALRPISEIGTTAARIAEGDLSQRINAAETESELGQLAKVLNATFARLDAAFAQQRQFTADAAHELRTPVSVLLTQTQTALQRDRSGPEYKDALEACQRAAQRMRGLIASLLELARLDAASDLSGRATFDLSREVTECADLVRPLAEARGVRVETALAPLSVHGDAEKIGRAVTNLLTNAIQYNRDGGRVQVALKAQNGCAVLTVHDTGIGIAPEHLSRVFDRFYRADAARSGETPHAGLGLAISKAIIEAHGGSIEAESDPGKGSTFKVRLPAAKAAAQG